MFNEKINADCPVCATKNLVFRQDTIFCKHCKKTIMTRPPKEEGTQALLKAESTVKGGIREGIQKAQEQGDL